MYRRRFGQDARSLDQIARGQWPIYHPASPALPRAATPTPTMVPADADTF
jgi:hypothetical protein